MKNKDIFTFNGFEPANTTPVPDILFDELLSQLSGSELKVLLYIIRRTRGFKKDSDAISLSQFQKGIITKDGKQLDKGCGIDDRQTIINALTSLEKKRCIVSEKCKTAKGDNATTVYRILFSQGVVGKANQGSREKDTTLVGNSNHRSGKKPTTVVGKSNPQETVLQQTDTQETDLQDESNSDDTPKPPVVSSDTAPASSLQDEEMFTDEPQGDTHATGNTANHDNLPARIHGHLPGDNTPEASGDTHRVAPSQCQETLEQTSTTPTPAQSLSLPQAEQAASGTVQHVDLNRGVTAFQEPVKPNQSEDQKAGKWNAQAMVARACALRGKPFSDMARPKETKAAHKLFDRKPDLTEEDFEKAWKQWDTQWWRETNGRFNLTDLAAVPKNKSEMRLVIALEKLALSKAITRQSGQIIPISGTKRYSSYDDPNFRSDQDFYPVEGGSYAAASR